MHLPDGILPSSFVLAGWFITLFALFFSLRSLHLEHALAGPRAMAFGLMLSLLVFLWSFPVGPYPGLKVHLVGGMLLTLMFGPSLALLTLAGLTMATAMFGHGGLYSVGINICIQAVVPVIVAQGLVLAQKKYLPDYFFVYIFALAFLGSAATIAALTASASVLYLSAGVFDSGFLLEHWWVAMVLNAWGEAWLTGMLMTIFVVYRPEWVTSFDDQRYLSGK